MVYSLKDAKEFLAVPFYMTDDEIGVYELNVNLGTYPLNENNWMYRARVNPKTESIQVYGHTLTNKELVDLIHKLKKEHLIVNGDATCYVKNFEFDHNKAVIEENARPPTPFAYLRLTDAFPWSDFGVNNFKFSSFNPPKFLTSGGQINPSNLVQPPPPPSPPKGNNDQADALAKAQKKISELENESIKSQQKIGDLEKEVIKSQQKISELEREASKSQQKVSELEREAIRSQQKVSELEREVIRSQQNISNLNIEVIKSEDKLKKFKTHAADSWGRAAIINARPLPPSIFDVIYASSASVSSPSKINETWLGQARRQGFLEPGSTSSIQSGTVKVYTRGEFDKAFWWVTALDLTDHPSTLTLIAYYDGFLGENYYGTPVPWPDNSCAGFGNSAGVMPLHGIIMGEKFCVAI